MSLGDITNGLDGMFPNVEDYQAESSQVLNIYHQDILVCLIDFFWYDDPWQVRKRNLLYS